MVLHKLFFWHDQQNDNDKKHAFRPRDDITKGLIPEQRVSGNENKGLTFLASREFADGL